MPFGSAITPLICKAKKGTIAVKYEETKMLNPYLTEERKAFQDMLVRFVATQMTPYIDEWDEANRGGLARIMRRG